MGKIGFCRALIKLVEKNESLWDVENAFYYDIETRQEVWLKIFNELKLRDDCTFSTGKLPWKMFLKQYLTLILFHSKRTKNTMEVITRFVRKVHERSRRDR